MSGGDNLHPSIAGPSPLAKMSSLQGNTSFEQINNLSNDTSSHWKSNSDYGVSSTVSEDKDITVKRAVRNLNEDEDDEDLILLASRLNALDPKKQKKLMAMIGRVEDGGSVMTDPNVSVLQESISMRHNKGNDLPTSSLRSESSSSQGLEGLSNITLQNMRSNSVVVDSVEDSQQSGNFHQCYPNSHAANGSNIHIRIKVYNSWVKTKFASLSGLRLCVRGENEEISLSEFKVQVTTGNDIQPKTAEIVRKVKNLFDRSRVKKKEDWIFPMVRNSCVQLELTGKVEDTISIDDLDLLVWNGSSDSNKNTSAAMDMDIYMGNTCIWTGCLDNWEKGCTKASYSSLEYATDFENVRLLVDHFGHNRKPTVIVALVPPKLKSDVRLNDSQKSTISTQLSHVRSNVTSSNMRGPPNQNGDNVTHLGFTGMSTSSSIGENISISALHSPEPVEQGLQQNGNEPMWFSDLKTPRSDIEKSSIRDDSIKFANTHGDHILNEIKHDTTVPKNMKTSSSRKLRMECTMTSVKPQSTTVGDQNDILKVNSQIGSNNPSVANHPKGAIGPKKGGRRRLNKEEQRAEESSLRHSLEALSKSDRRTRGRIESELQTYFSKGEKSHLIEDARANPELELHNMDCLSDGVLDNEIEKQNVLKLRSNRIDEVQETVSSALQDLASVMSNLTKSGVMMTQVSPVIPQTESISECSPPVMKAKSPNSYTERSSVDMISTLNDELKNALSCEGATKLPHCDVESSTHEIPVLPSGQVLQFDILSTWGDPYYVGLNGIDIFDINGEVLTVGHGVQSVTAVPCDINDLPEYDNDPRTVSNLLDETNLTRDDLHVWLAPHGHTLSPPLPHVATVTIVFTRVVSLSLVRLWNYNKSRTHSHRGVKRTRLQLDKNVIFEGEIRMSPGLITSADDCSEVILFSTSNSVLEKISQYDVEMGYRSNDDEATSAWVTLLKERRTNFRPRTSDGIGGNGDNESPAVQQSKNIKPSTFAPNIEETMRPQYRNRPLTGRQEDKIGNNQVDCAGTSEEDVNSVPSESIGPLLPIVDQVVVSSCTAVEGGLSKYALHPQSNSNPVAESVVIDHSLLSECDLVSCRVLTLLLESTWGDKCYVGLCGIEVTLGCSSLVAEVLPGAIDASPRDLSSIGVFDDPRIPENLVDGVNNTTDDQHMWLIPFTSGGSHKLQIDLGSRCKISGFNVWNYNKSAEDALRGVRVVTVLGDGVLIGQQELRIAPGCDGVAYKQGVLLRDIKNSTMRKQQKMVTYSAPSLRQDYETPCNVSGMMWKIDIYSNWGDGYYVGLDGIEFLDNSGHVIDILKSATLESSPHMWDIDIGKGDPREPRNLGLGRGFRSPWLSPLAQSITRTEQMSCLTRVLPLRSQTSSKMDHDAIFYDHNVLFVLFDRPVNVSVIR
mmetsp:Transcript_19318/g.32414  ORF Transcript_19318/g.32414 Transcript_19318/m.32414 type:complete len:1405 (+) Transcript_19318:858-5072(+)